MARKPRLKEDAAFRETPRDPQITRGILPASWAGKLSLPVAGAHCSCCKFTRFWSDEAGWRCAVCHPPVRPGEIFDTNTEGTDHHGEGQKVQAGEQEVRQGDQVRRRAQGAEGEEGQVKADLFRE